MPVPAAPVKSTSLPAECAFSACVSRSILALHPVPFRDLERLPDFQ
ncbi:hypothetical protein C4K00_3604 [Pseudomonas synxantha]|nr:hypothetical protein C4K00_3604 [Pseudomonas synxantha]